MSQDAGGMFLLVVDDDEIMRELLTALLEAAGHRVVSAHSQATALVELIAAADRLDAVLTDLRMPEVDTLAMLRAMRNALRGSTRLIGMSGSDAEPEELELLDGFLLKPFSVEEFSATVERARAGAAQASPTFQAVSQRDAPVLDLAIYDNMAKALPGKALRELYDLTLQDVAKRRSLIRDAAATGDADTCKSEAHAMKGGCGMVGAMELRAIAADIETGAAVNTPVLQEIEAATERLQRMLNALTL